MRRYLIGLLCILFLCAPAHADVLVDMVTKMDGPTLATRCGGEGARYQDFPNGVSLCTKDNCDGKGGTCSITCDANQNCIGSTPDRDIDLTGLTGGAPSTLAPPQAFGLGHITKGQLQSACRSVPGAIFGAPDGTRYFCGNSKCDPGIGPCYIECDLSKCTAGMPKKPTGRLTLVAILQGGKGIIHGGQLDDGSATKSGPAPDAPKAPPVVLIP